MLERYLSRIDWERSVSTNWWHVDTFWFFFYWIKVYSIDSSQTVGILLKSQTSTSYSSNSTGSFVTSSWFTPFIACKSIKWKFYYGSLEETPSWFPMLKSGERRSSLSHDFILFFIIIFVCLFVWWWQKALVSKDREFGASWGPLHTRAKSRDHEFVRAHKKVSKGHRPNTPLKSCDCDHGPSSVMWSHMWPGPQPNAISMSYHPCGSSHMIK